MREIKFRAWDKNDNEMFYSTTYQDKTSMGFGLGNFLTECSDIEDTLMQYTGLKDKNYVDIYEGDIIRCTHGTGFIEYIDSYFRIFKPYVFSTNLINEVENNTLCKENTVEVIGFNLVMQLKYDEV